MLEHCVVVWASPEQEGTWSRVERPAYVSKPINSINTTRFTKMEIKVGVGQRLLCVKDLPSSASSNRSSFSLAIARLRFTFEYTGLISNAVDPRQGRESRVGEDVRDQWRRHGKGLCQGSAASNGNITPNQLHPRHGSRSQRQQLVTHTLDGLHFSLSRERALSADLGCSQARSPRTSRA